ncbi:MAG: TetR/AcrR family transcriptional regulator [Candidatus Wallbacteria bacterium]|nr:TetR/AcrR family transcriptional regulator [Candidatus Wallbacteria bacterium]
MQTNVIKERSRRIETKAIRPKATLRKTTVIRRRELILTARSIIFNEGTGNFTLRRLADEVGLTEAAIYRHFDNKEEILLALVDFMYDGWDRKLNALLEKKIPPREKLMKLGKIHLTQLLKHQFNPVMLFSEAVDPRQPKIAEAIIMKRKRLFEVIGIIVREGCDTGIFRSRLDVQAAVLALSGVLQNCIIRWTLTKKTKFLKSEMERAMALIIDGLS